MTHTHTVVEPSGEIWVFVSWGLAPPLEPQPLELLVAFSSKMCF